MFLVLAHSCRGFCLGPAPTMSNKVLWLRSTLSGLQDVCLDPQRSQVSDYSLCGCSLVPAPVSSLPKATKHWLIQLYVNFPYIYTMCYYKYEDFIQIISTFIILVKFYILHFDSQALVSLQISHSIWSVYIISSRSPTHLTKYTNNVIPHLYYAKTYWPLF